MFNEEGVELKKRDNEVCFSFSLVGVDGGEVMDKIVFKKGERNSFLAIDRRAMETRYKRCRLPIEIRI